MALVVGLYRTILLSTHQMVSGFKDITTEISLVIKVLFWIVYGGVYGGHLHVS